MTSIDTLVKRQTMYKDIFEAAANGTVDDVRFFVEQGVDVNVKDDNDWMSLHYATIYTSNADVVKYLIEQGADVNAKVDISWAPWHTALRPDTGWTPVHFAARYNNILSVKYLIDAGANVNAKTALGMTVLHVALVHHATIELLEYLLDQGADLNAIDNQGLTPLLRWLLNTHIRDDAIERIDNAVAKLKHLIAHGADVNASVTPLDLAVAEPLKVVIRESGGKSGAGL